MNLKKLSSAGFFPWLRFIGRTFFAGMTILGAGSVSGQDYPNKTIRIVISAPGGGNDFLTRQIAQGISGPLGQPVIVEYRGSGFLAAEFVSKTPPDGHALTAQGAIFWTIPLLRPTPYDVQRDFSPISLLVREVTVLVVHPSLPVKSVKELIALAKAGAGALNYGSVGIGSGSHLATELFKSMAGVNIVHVPYKGTAVSLTAVLSGEAQMTFTDAGNVVGHMKTGRLRGLAITSAAPSLLAPGLPTVSASGLPGYESVNMTSMFAAANTPASIISRLNQEIVRVLNQADVKARLLNAGVEVVGSSPEQLAATIKSEIAKLGKVIKDAGIKVD